VPRNSVELDIDLDRGDVAGVASLMKEELNDVVDGFTERMAATLDDGNERATRGGRGRDRDSGGGDDSAGSAVRSLVLGQVIGPAFQQFNPLRTALEQNEAALRASASAAGAGAGFLAGTPFGTGGQIVGAQLGQQAAEVGVEAFLQSEENAQARFVSQRVRGVLSEEASVRAGLGEQLDASDASDIARQVAQQAALEFQNQLRAVEAVNRLDRGPVDIVGVVEDLKETIRDMGLELASGAGVGLADTGGD